MTYYYSIFGWTLVPGPIQLSPDVEIDILYMDINFHGQTFCHLSDRCVVLLLWIDTSYILTQTFLTLGTLGSYLHEHILLNNY